MVFLVGRHLNSGGGGGFTNLPSYSKELGYNIFQIFLGAPQQILSKGKKISDLEEFGKELTKNDILVVIHGSYTINLCHTKGSAKFKASVKSLTQDLIATQYFKDRCLGVVVHMGKNIPENKIIEDEAIQNYVVGIEESLRNSPAMTKIILETGASQGSEVASKIDGLSKIYWALTEDSRARVRFCIDTCHVWATGYNISTKSGVINFFKEFDKSIGIKKISCIHLNDSKNARESRVDRHADLGYGFVGEPGLMAVTKFAKSNSIPIIMETPLSAIDTITGYTIGYEDELNMVKEWAK